MRDYIFIYHQPEKNLIVLSGVELKDLMRYFVVGGGFLWLDHKLDHFYNDPRSGFDYTNVCQSWECCLEAIASWGDFSLVDFRGSNLPILAKKDISELLYFKHSGEPFDKIAFRSLANKFLITGHDDGWKLKIYYHHWADILSLLEDIMLLDNESVREVALTSEGGAFWIDASGLIVEALTDDIDLILNRRLINKNAKSQG